MKCFINCTYYSRSPNFTFLRVLSLYQCKSNASCIVLDSWVENSGGHYQNVCYRLPEHPKICFHEIICWLAERLPMLLPRGQCPYPRHEVYCLTGNECCDSLLVFARTSCWWGMTTCSQLGHSWRSDFIPGCVQGGGREGGWGLGAWSGTVGSETMHLNTLAVIYTMNP